MAFACLVGLAVPLEVYGEGLHGADCLPHVLRGIDDGGLGFCGRRRRGRGEERWVAEGFTATRVCASDEATSAVLTSLVAIDDISGNVFRTSVQGERGSEEATLQSLDRAGRQRTSARRVGPHRRELGCGLWPVVRCRRVYKPHAYT